MSIHEELVLVSPDNPKLWSATGQPCTRRNDWGNLMLSDRVSKYQQL